jgi:S-DNA-T family DNA segregation ATPase FtsK/SpoIIIE
VAWPVSSATLDGAAVLALGAAIGLGLAFSAAAREWALAALGYGWVPVGGWLVAFCVALRYQPRALARRWRWWLSGAALVAIAVGVLALFNAHAGMLAEVSLGGRWGNALSGAPLLLGSLKLLAIAVLVPLLVYPRQVGRAYLRVLGKVGLACKYTAVQLYQDSYNRTRSLARLLRRLLTAQDRRRWLRQLHLSAPEASAKSQQRPTRSAVAAASVDSADSTPAEAPELWANTEPGTIPDWDPTDPAPQQGTSPSVGAAQAAPGKSIWRLPPIDILSAAKQHDPPQAPLQQMARHIEKSLAEHGVMVEVKDIRAGPRIVRFGLVPGWVTKKGEADKGGAGEGVGERSRVKVQSILTREKDLALALKTPYLRIEAPVPGEALVGLEVPTPSPRRVPLRTVVDDAAFGILAAKGGLPIALGQDTGGNAVVMDLTVLPHVLIAGATGSGKSVCINSIIASLLLTKPPEQMRMLMVDPKRVELTPYNGIPHLIAPVIVEADAVSGALRSLIREMLHRYRQLEEVRTRNIAGYNAKARERMPYLVVIVDELADLMIAGGFEVEQNLIRLAQLGRAIGIHLILATQRPSVNVVTGLLKANIVARVAFAVATQVDSRVILDMAGAEKLLGKGDMLLLNNDSPKPRRVQGTLVTDREINKMVEFWLKQKGPPLPQISIDDAGEDDEEQDARDERILEQARGLALRNPHLSTSFLARRFKIGEQRAAQVREALAEEGLVLPQ